jgi:hypothetical protein
MLSEFKEGWGWTFLKLESPFSKAMWDMNGIARKERWDDKKYVQECLKIKELNLSHTQPERQKEILNGL